MRDEIHAVNLAWGSTKRPRGPAGERVLLDGKAARRELALQDLTNFLMIGCPHEPRQGELAK